jgi:hypothetical protein
LNFTGIDSVKLELYSEYPTQIISRMPEVTGVGTAYIDNFYLHTVLYAYSGTDLSINGKVSFDVGFCDTFTQISAFNTDANLKKAVLTSNKVWNEWNDVPWATILTSPEHLVFIGIVIMCSLTLLLVQRYKRKEPWQLTNKAIRKK